MILIPSVRRGDFVIFKNTPHKIQYDYCKAKKLNIKIAVELSYIDEKSQSIVYDLVYDQKKYKLDLKKAVTLKKASEKRFFNEDRIKLILTGEGTVRKNDKLILTKTEYGKYVEKFKSADDMKKAIIKFLEEYRESE